ncbi:hypothetical protein CPB83DRAFT_214127 [Crepidotus variabilis]|uniref:F-box domain-containing protein n=1 Tax=Crepidotus variabilis TaxID=179855 RepID=A0A9P6ETJ8_9AGAR|nr:hypothetical protein CPB83DRAFT_214127 [Crepidotus variabilis]
MLMYTFFRQFNYCLPSPVKSLPTEILHEVFSWIIFFREHDLSYQWPNIQDIPLYIGQICSLWRSVALKTPLLWRTLPVLELHYPESTRSAIQLIILEDLMRRLGPTSAFDFKIIVRSEVWGRHCVILDRLTHHSSQWRVANFQCHWELFMGESLGDIINRLPLLEKLELSIFSLMPEVPTSDIILILFFSSAPRLRSVAVAGFPVQWLKLPFAQFEEYKEAKVTINLFLHVSHPLLDNLTSLSLSSSTYLPVVEKPVTLPKLRRLGMTLDNGPFIPSLSFFYFSSLTSLRLESNSLDTLSS